MRQRLSGEAGMSLVELLAAMVILGFLLAGLANVFVSGLRASSDSSARLSSQVNTRTAVSRLEYEVRCASGATVGGSGANVALTLPSQCSHATGSYTWCVSSAKLYRYSGTTCSGSSQIFATNVTTATPFTLVTATGYLPRLQINLTVNSSGGRSDAVSIADVLTLRNGARS